MVKYPSEEVTPTIPDDVQKHIYEDGIFINTAQSRVYSNLSFPLLIVPCNKSFNSNLTNRLQSACCCSLSPLFFLRTDMAKSIFLGQCSGFFIIISPEGECRERVPASYVNGIATLRKEVWSMLCSFCPGRHGPCKKKKSNLFCFPECWTSALSLRRPLKKKERRHLPPSARANL